MTIEPDPAPVLTRTGQFSPLRYPGGKGKLVQFVKDIILANNLADGLYVEPYAGGGAVAWELLLTGVVRRIALNDISPTVYAFWDCVLNKTEELCERIENVDVTVAQWDVCKETLSNYQDAEQLDLAFSFFFLNRTNRSGILNGGIIGGREQNGEWKIDARFNKPNLVSRIRKIGNCRKRVTLTCEDAAEFLKRREDIWPDRTFIYLDPPYYEKGRYLYYDSYNENDHLDVSNTVKSIQRASWIVSYDDVRPIHDLYATAQNVRYALDYSARQRGKGTEAMFFSDDLLIPSLPANLLEASSEVHPSV